MAVHVQCSGCGKAYSLQDTMAGRRVKCPACGATMEVPAAGLPGDIPVVEPLAAAGPGANAALQIKLIGIFDIIAGGLSILWGLLMIFGIIGVLTGAMEEDPDAPPAAVMIGLYIGMLVLSIGAGIVEILAGVQVLKRRPGSRKLALVAAIVCCASAWGCCIWPLTLAAGIYSLVALNKDSVKTALGG